MKGNVAEEERSDLGRELLRDQRYGVEEAVRSEAAFRVVCKVRWTCSNSREGVLLALADAAPVHVHGLSVAAPAGVAHGDDGVLVYDIADLAREIKESGARLSFHLVWAARELCCSREVRQKLILLSMCMATQFSTKVVLENDFAGSHKPN